MQRNWSVNGGKCERHRDDRADELASTFQRRIHARHAFAHVTLHIFNNDDRVVHHQSDRKHNRQQRQQIQREPERLHEEHRPDERNRDRHHGHDHGAERPEEQEDHQHYDEQRVDQSLYDFVDRVVDVRGRVIGDFSIQARGQFALDLFHLDAHSLDHIHRVRVRQNVDAHEDRFLSGEPHFGVVVFGTENDVRDVTQPDESSFVFPHDKFFKIVCRVQISVRREIHLKQRAFCASHRCEIIIARKGGADLRRRDVQRRHAIGFHPDSHREVATAEDVGLLHSADGGQPRLHQPHEVIRDFVRLKNVRRET